MEEKIEQKTDLAKDFDRLKEKVLITAPILKQTREQHGSETLYAHAQGYTKITSPAAFLDRQAEFIGVVAGQVGELLGEQTAQSVAAQLQKHYFVSTSDHHGPICHPFSLSANLIAAAPSVDPPGNNLKNIIVLSCANVSLNNSSFPRGLVFHSDIGDPNQLHHISFFPAKDSAHAVYGQRPFAQSDMIHAQKLIGDKVARGDVRREKAKKIIEIINDLYNQPSVLCSNNFAEQILKTNFQLWQKFFGPGKQVPNLIYIDIETITSRLLCNFLLNRDTVVGRIIENPDYENLIIKHFDNIIGAFSTKQQTGTYLFWALAKGKKYRQRLWVRGKELVTADGSFRVSLQPETIKKKLKSSELIPSTLLSFLVTSFYYGVTCLGGFSQPSYLTAMKQAYINLLQDIGENAEAEKCKQVETAIMGGDMALALLQDKHGGWHQATGLDLILYGAENLAGSIVHAAKTLTFAEATDIMMPLYYEVMYPEHERDKKLLQISESQIAKLIGLDKKITPCVFM